MTGFCERCELSLDQCEHGRGLVARRGVALDLVADGPTILATQHSRCPGCGHGIEPDQPITHTEDGWAHAEEVSPKESVKAMIDHPANFEGIQ